MYPRDLTWIKLKEYIECYRGPLIIPIGSVESHGAHLPINTDTIIASFIADMVAERNKWISLPPITYTIAVPVRPGNVYVNPSVFRDYLRCILEHFISFGQRRFIIIMGHGGPDMKNSIMDACNDLCRKYDVQIAAFHISHILRELSMIEVSDKHAGTWETSIMMAIDYSLVKNLNLYKINDPRKYGVSGDPLKASQKKGFEYINMIVNRIEEEFARIPHKGCYYNWLN